MRDMMFNGVQIISSPLAREIRTEFKVAAWPTRKKRKGWMVQRVEINRPGCYRMGDMLVMHPDLIARLKVGAPAGGA